MGISNVAVALVVPMPALVFYALVLRHPYSSPTFDSLGTWSATHPLMLLNALFFVNVNVLFWIISLLQQSTWLIDPYWTILPVLITHFFATHPASKAEPLRSRVVTSLVWIWSIRLTHSYFRREDWKLGAREDWRFAEMRRKYKNHWWWISFFAVYVSQQIFLVGICLPIYAVHQSELPWDHFPDTAIVLLCLLGIWTAYVADTQLYEFVRGNKSRPESAVLDAGIWHYSRHPNYFGEQLWWWGLSLFAWRLGFPWMMLGAAVNTACLAYVTLLVEERMLRREARAAAYAHYQKTTSVWIPWFKRKLS